MRAEARDLRIAYKAARGVAADGYEIPATNADRASHANAVNVIRADAAAAAIIAVQVSSGTATKSTAVSSSVIAPEIPRPSRVDIDYVASLEWVFRVDPIEFEDI